MENTKLAPNPLQSCVKLIIDCQIPLCDPTTYYELIGSLIYLTHTHRNISYAVVLCFRYMQKPHELHWKAIKWILRYLQGTIFYGLTYNYCKSNLQLIGYTNFDWAGDSNDHKSTAGYIFFLESSPITWSSKKMQALALSTTEANIEHWLKLVKNHSGLKLY